jgi:predicted Zn-dependent protease
MKNTRCFYWTLILTTTLFMASCAQKQSTTIPRSHRPPENVPQIGSTAPNPAPSAQEPARLAALDSLIDKATTQLNRHQPEAAFSTLERALSIDGQDPVIWHLMARARFDQGRYDQAVSLAKKSNTLAWNQPSLKEKNKRIIAGARERQEQVQKE